MSHRHEKKDRQGGRAHRITVAVATLAILGVLAPLEAQAYVGPGAGITAIGTFLAFVAGMFFAIVGFIWYPIKRLRRKWREKRLDQAPRS